MREFPILVRDFCSRIHFEKIVFSQWTGRKGRIMPRAKHFAQSNMMWSNVAYVDQWKKVMAIFDDRKNLRAVVKQIDYDAYGVLLIGDDTEVLYYLNDIRLGSTGKNMEACFQIYCRLQHLDTPSFTPSYRRTEKVKLHQIFPHTRVSAMRAGGFRVTTDDLSEIIAIALNRYEEITSGDVKTLDLVEYDDYSGYPDMFFGEGGVKMFHVGDGAYCDDDGDNWEFL